MKVKVTRNNFHKVLQVLKNIFEGPVEVKTQYDVKGFKYQDISEEFLTYYRTAEITRHWMLNSEHESFGPKSNLKPVIHIDFLSGGHAMVVEEGDIVDLGNGSTLILRESDDFIKKTLGKNNFTTSFRKVKMEDVETELLQAEMERVDEMVFYESTNIDYEVD